MTRIDDDDIFVGRFVLIDYNEGDIFKKYYKQLYRGENNGEEKLYFQTGENVFTEATVAEDINYYKELESGTTIINPEYNAEENRCRLLINEPFYIYEDNKYYFYECQGQGKFSLIYSSQENDDVYSINFKIDSLVFDINDRGWDSTVWQKIVYNNSEKYAMIAELNSLVPEIKLCIDAPTLAPQAPYFDVGSTDKKYNLHVQPSWGIRIAEAKDGISDVTVESALAKWNEDLGEIANTTEGYPGDIYFNKAGFSADKGYKSNKTDLISFLPTGVSGYKYSDQQGDEPQADIKELSICLPSIGNAISNLWDIVYGGNSDPNNTSSYDRNTNIDWNNISGLRLVSLSDNGYTYDTEYVNTLAGCINSVHDLMGMIIIDENTNGNDYDVNLALNNYIYYTENTYKIKNLTYNYESIPDDIEQVRISNMIDFSAENTYYKGNDNYYKADQYQFGNKYYKLNKIELVENLTSEVWKKNFYYYCNKDTDNNDIYLLEEKEQPQSHREYFKLDIENLNSITSVDNKTSIFHPTLYKTETLDTMFPTESIKDAQGKQIGGNGLFYQLQDENGDKYFVLYDITKHPNIDTTNAMQWRYFKNYQIEMSTDLKGNPIKTYEFNKSGTTSVELNIVPFESGTFYYLNKNNQAEHLHSVKNIDISKNYKYYKLIDADKNINSFVPIEGKFYWPRQYYYKDGNNYIYAKENNKIKDKTYYILNNIVAYPAKSETIFYEPNKYAYIENGQWIIDTNPTMSEKREYYINIQTRYNQTTGEVLNPHILNKDYKKMGITPCYRQEKYEWKELTGFARTLNTIHGLILHINNILKTDDKFTRDLNTVQGCINQMNDIINKIESLKPNNLIAVNEYGKMTSMELAGDDTWISTSVNAEKSNEIKISHQKSELNSGIYKPGNATSLKFGDQLKILTYTTDDAGHLVDSGIETVTLPIGSVNDAQPSGADVITHLNFIEKTGALSTTRTNIATLKLTEYSKGSANADIQAGDTLGSALSKLQTQIIDEENARSAVLGTITDTANNKTVYGAHAYAADIATNIENNYIKQTAAPGYADILTKAAAKDAYEPIGAESRAKTYADTLAPNYATAAQGALAATAVQPAALENYYTKTFIDELIARIQTLETKVAALESVENPS